MGELLDVCRANGMRLVGPNCMGVVNTDPDVSLTATFARADVPAGTIGFVSQSGAFGAAAIDGASRRGIGLSAFVSLGDKADLSSNDFLQYWEQDPATEVVALYLESFGNPRKFGRVSRRVARAKPVLAVKAGRTSAGARAALVAHGRADRGVRRHGRRAVRQRRRDPLRRPRRSAGRRRGARPSSRCRAGTAWRSWPTRAARWSSAPTRARTRASTCRDEPRRRSAPRQIRGRLRRGGRAHGDSAVDAVIAIYVEHIAIGADAVAAALAALDVDVPLLAVFMTPGELPLVLRAAGRRASDPCGRKVPTFRAPERAARALGRAAAYARWRSTPPVVAAASSTTSTPTRRPRSSPGRSPAAAAGCGRTRSSRCWAPTGSRWSSSGGRRPSPARRRRRPSSGARSR